MQGKYPEVSIILPVYNTPNQMLNRAISSVLNQANCSCEILLVDDGSNLCCRAECDLAAKNDSRVKVIHLEKNTGVSNARNIGINNASGEFLIFADPDDEMIPNVVHKGYALCKNNELDCLFATVVDVDGDFRHWRSFDFTESVFRIEEDADILRMLAAYFLSHESCNREIISRSIPTGPIAKMIRRSLLDEIRFDQRLRVLEDTVFNYEVVSKSKRIGFLDEPWYLYYVNPNSAMRTLSFEYDLRQHWDAVLSHVADHSLMNAAYSHMCTLYLMILNSLSESGTLSRKLAKQGFDIPCIRSSFHSLDTSQFDYPSITLKIKYYLACRDHICLLTYLFYVLSLLKKIRR